jgi:hypothetical protein
MPSTHALIQPTLAISVSTPTFMHPYPRHTGLRAGIHVAENTYYEFIINLMDITPFEIALYYKQRWEIELFLNG